MDSLEFVAAQVGTEIDDGQISTGASTGTDDSAQHYVLLQFDPDARSSDGIYFEIDDQINGCYGNVSSVELTDHNWILTLKRGVRNRPDLRKVVVTLSPENVEALRVSLGSILKVLRPGAGNGT